MTSETARLSNNADIKNFAENITDNTSFPSSVTPEKPKSFILTRIIRRSGTSADKRGVPLGWGSGSGRL